MVANRRKTKTQELLEFVDKYHREHGGDRLSLLAVARQAMREGFSPHRPSPEVQLARQFARAMRQEKITDPQDRKVRRWHATRNTKITEDGEFTQEVFWQELEHADPKFMQVSVQQQRDDILHDCLALEATWASYNDNNKFGAKLKQLNFDFTPDIEEAKQSPEYPDSRPEDDGDDDELI